MIYLCIPEIFEFVLGVSISAKALSQFRAQSPIETDIVIFRMDQTVDYGFVDEGRKKVQRKGQEKAGEGIGLRQGLDTGL